MTCAHADHLFCSLFLSTEVEVDTAGEEAGECFIDKNNAYILYIWLLF